MPQTDAAERLLNLIIALSHARGASERDLMIVEESE